MLKTPPEGKVMAIRQFFPANITATTTFFRFKASTNILPLGFRICPNTAFDRTSSDETYVLELQDDTVKCSTDNAAVTNTNNTSPIECTFTQGSIIAKDSWVVGLATLGGTSPIIPAGSLLEFEYAEV